MVMTAPAGGRRRSVAGRLSRAGGRWWPARRGQDRDAHRWSGPGLSAVRPLRGADLDRCRPWQM